MVIFSASIRLCSRSPAVSIFKPELALVSGSKFPHEVVEGSAIKLVEVIVVKHRLEDGCRFTENSHPHRVVVCDLEEIVLVVMVVVMGVLMKMVDVTALVMIIMTVVSIMIIVIKLADNTVIRLHYYDIMTLK